MEYKILNRKGEIRIILIHGLFATSGYWLNYLFYFKNCQIIVLNIDYNKPLNLNNFIQEIESLIDRKFNGVVDFIFSHSLGTVLANGISEMKFKMSFEICPVYCSKRIGKEEFIHNILERSNKEMDIYFIYNKLAEVDSVISEVSKTIISSKKRVVFFPTNDIYFEYLDIKQSEVRIFEGDHFSIENALRKAFSIIDLLNN